MLTMILADDDFLVRETLREAIDWEHYGIKIIGESEDGQQALTMCTELRPDILFTDIKMPYLTGLDVALSLKESGNKTKIILISGVQDFNYAKTALEVNAEGYILKPIRMEEVNEVIKKVLTGINMERNREEIIMKMRQELKENFSLIRDKFLRNLILGVFNQDKDIEDKLAYFNIPFAYNESPITAVLQIDDYLSKLENFTEEDKQLLNFSIQNIMQEIMENYDAGIAVCLNDNEFIMLFNELSQHYQRHNQICKEIIDRISSFLDISVSVGIGLQVSSMQSLLHSYNKAMVALNYKFYTGKGSLISIDDISDGNALNTISQSSAYGNIFEMHSNMLSFIKLGNSEKALEAFNHFIDHYINSNVSDIEYVRGICIELICISYRYIYENGDDMEHLLSGRMKAIEEIIKSETVFSMKDVVIVTITEITLYFSNKYNERQINIAYTVKEIINRRYKENITISDIADEMYMSQNYISLVFKKETGETVKDYLTTTRMEAAKAMLKDTKVKVWQVAENLGFENHHYFSSVFKKYTGLQPQQYRNAIWGKE